MSTITDDIPVGWGDISRSRARVLRTTGNGLLYNAFPIRYYESGTVKVAHPNAGPPIKTPTVLAAP